MSHFENVVFKENSEPCLNRKKSYSSNEYLDQDKMTENESEEILFPGDYIATSEEFIPGEGTFEEEGNIFSAVLGKLNINKNEMVAEVIPVIDPPVNLKRDDIVIGRVARIVKGYIFVEINHKKGVDREVIGETYARLHISKISTSFIKDVGQAFSESDIIRAKVIQTEPSLEISTLDIMFE